MSDAQDSDAHIIDLVDVVDRLCQGTIDPDEQQQLAIIIAANPQLTQELQRQWWMHNILHADLGEHLNSTTLSTKVKHVINGERHSAVLRLNRAVRNDITKRQRRHRLRTFTTAAAALLLAGITTATWLIVAPTTRENITHTQSSVTWHDSSGNTVSGHMVSHLQARSITGSDGSRIDLDPLTRMYLHNGQRIELISGAINATITPRAAADQLIFELDSHTVTVIGTQLQLTRRGPLRHITVDEGSVLVAQSDQSDQTDNNQRTLNTGEMFFHVDPSIAEAIANRDQEPNTWQLPHSQQQPATDSFVYQPTQDGIPSLWSDTETDVTWHDDAVTITHRKNNPQATTWFNLPPASGADFRIAFDIDLLKPIGVSIGSNGRSLNPTGFPPSVTENINNWPMERTLRYEMQFRSIKIIENLGIMTEFCLLLNNRPIMRRWLLNPDQTFGISGNNSSYTISNIRFGPLE